MTARGSRERGARTRRPRKPAPLAQPPPGAHAPDAGAAPPASRAPFSTRTLLAVVFAANLAVRLVFLARLSHTPYWGTFSADGRAYWDWASWLLAHGGRGAEPFFLGPLYPYFVAALRVIPGVTLPGVLVVQAFLGAAAATCLASVFARVLPWRAALVAMALFCGAEHYVLYDAQPLMESLLFSLECALLALVVPPAVARAAAPLGTGRLIAAATLVALLAQGRAIHAVLFLPLALLPGAARSVADRLRRAAVVALVAALSLAPGAWHNWRATGTFIPFTYSAGFNAYVGNHTGATGGYSPPTGTFDSEPAPGESPDGGGAGRDGRVYLQSRAGRAIAPAESNRQWWSLAAASAREQPWGALRLLSLKALMLFNVTEYWQQLSLESYRLALGRWGIPHAPLVVLLVGLAPLGFVSALRRGGAAAFPAWYVVLLAAATACFFVTDRYRLHLLPGLWVLAACGVSEALARMRAGSWPRLAAAAALVAAGAALALLPLPHRPQAQVDWTARMDLGGAYLERREYAEAAVELHRAIQIARPWQRARIADASEALAVAGLYAEYGAALVSLDQQAAAVPWLTQAAVLAPQSRTIGLLLAKTEALTGDAPAALDRLRRFGVDPAHTADEFFRMAFDEDRRRRPDRVELLLRASHALAPGYPPAAGGLIKLLAASGRTGEARTTLDASPMDAQARGAYGALISLDEGDTLAARSTLALAVREAPSSDPGVGVVFEYLRAALGDRGAAPEPPPGARR